MTHILLYSLLGGVAGFVSGLIGIGEGVIIVPALIFGFGLSQHEAQGTTLAMLVPPVGLIEPNPFMLTYLEQEAKRQGIKRVEFQQGVAEQLPVEDNSVETVVSTHVLCSVRDLQASLQEINPILKPDGKFIFS